VAVSLAAATACERAAGLVPGLKWPNDLVVGELKLGGILAEAIPSGPDDTSPAVVVGLGLNVQWPPPDSEELTFPATSIWRETRTRVDPLELLDLVLEELETRLGDLADGAGRTGLAGEFRRRCDTVGKAVLASRGRPPTSPSRGTSWWTPGSVSRRWRPETWCTCATRADLPSLPENPSLSWGLHGARSTIGPP